MQHSVTPVVQLLLHILDEGYYKKAWHGPNLRGSIRGLTVEQASWRPGPGRHNIWEIVVHTAYWKYIVRRRVTGEKRGSFPLKGSNWFKRPMVVTKEAWREDLLLLEHTHATLRAAVARIRHSALTRKPPGSKVTTAAMIAGIAAHDFYHAGQIQLIKRLMQE